MRALIYCRYSTDKQRDTSIEDQARGCRARAEREGWQIVAQHADTETSGSTPVALRSGGKSLLADALAGRFDVLLLEGLDRLSRDIGEQDRIVKRLEYRGIIIVGVADSYDTRAAGRKVMRIARGLVNELYLDDLRAKTHRGLTGQVARGYHAGGLSYGYRSIVVGDPLRPDGHRLEVDVAAAEWVRWIFAHFADGWSCQRIAAELNRQHVVSPRRSTWCVSALYGSPAKGSGILNNELYIGRYVWNRSQWIKDPDTGRRQRIDRPRHEWQISERPLLRLLGDDLWQAVRDRIGRHRHQGGARTKGATPRTLFGGLLTCGICGGAVVAVNKVRYGCAAHKDRGATVCAGVLIPRQPTDARLLTLVRGELLTPGAIATLQSEVNRLLAERLQHASATAHAGQQRRGELEREIRHLVDAIVGAGTSPALTARLATAEVELADLRQTRTQARQEGPPCDVGAAYRRKVIDLDAALQRDIPRARGLLRDMLGDIRLAPEGEKVYAEIDGRAERLLLAAGGSFLGVVAGTGFGSRKLRIRLK